MGAQWRLAALVAMVLGLTAFARGEDAPLPKGAIARLGSKANLRTGTTPTGMALTPDSRHVIVSDAKTVSMWDLKTGALVGTAPVSEKYTTTPKTSNRSDPPIRLNLNQPQGLLSVAEDGSSAILAHRAPTDEVAYHQYTLPIETNRAPTQVLDRNVLESPAAIINLPGVKKTFGLSFRGRLLELKGVGRFGRLAIPPVAGDRIAIATGGGLIAIGGEDKRVRLWDAANDRELASVDTPEAVRSLALSADGKILVASSYALDPKARENKGSVLVWNIPEGKSVSRWPESSNRVAVSPDGKLVAAARGGGRIALHDSATGKLVQDFGAAAATYPFVEFTQDGLSLVAGSNTGNVSIWEVASGRQRFEKTGHTSGITGVHVLPSGEFLTSGMDGFVRTWSATGNELKSFVAETRGVSGMLASGDGKTVFTIGNASAFRVRAWNRATGEKLREYELNLSESLAPFSLASNGKTLAVGFAASGIHLLDIETFKLLGKLPMKPGDTIAMPMSLAFAADGRLISREGDRYHIWDVDKATILKSVEIRRSTSAARGPLPGLLSVSPDGTRFAAPSFNRAGKNALGEWSTKSAEPAGSFDLPKAGTITVIRHHPEGKLIAVGDANGNVWLVDTLLKSEPIALEGHDGPVLSLEFSKDGRTLMTGGADTTALIWSLPPP